MHIGIYIVLRISHSETGSIIVRVLSIISCGEGYTQNFINLRTHIERNHAI